MSTGLKPLFLFSLPRSGSTLVQRILAAHEDIATATEPHLLLHHIYSLKDRNVYSRYCHQTTVWAIQDFCSGLPNGVDDYLTEMRTFVLRLYAKAVKGDAKYFLDKTPKYHFIVEDIMHLFPKGKFIFLWRNPLAVASSIMETWKSGRWNLYHYETDLFDGLGNLIAVYDKYVDQACALRYEDLLANPEEELRRVFAYLELPFDAEVLSRFPNVQLEGRVRDPNMDMKQYQTLSQAPLEKWKRTLVNPIRKIWCRRYLRWIGKERLAVMGYDLDELLAELAALPLSLHYAGSDMWRILYGMAYHALEFRIIRHKIQNLLSGQRIYMHT